MPTPTLRERALRLLALHDRREVLRLPNAWDAGSARVFAGLGFAAIATTSAGVAWSLGHPDGERAPRTEVVAALGRIVSATQLPVTVDLEGGYGETPDAVAAHVRELIDVGAAGVNLEDGVDHERLRALDDAVARIAAARRASSDAGVPIVLNARVDVWMVERGPAPSERLGAAVERARAYLSAGADCVYPIALTDAETIGAFVRAVDAPVNIGLRPGVPDIAALGRLGVARVSAATRFATIAYAAAHDAARALRDDGRVPIANEPSLGYADLQRFMSRG